MNPSLGEEHPYAGPPPTGPYGAPPQVPGTWHPGQWYPQQPLYPQGPWYPQAPAYPRQAWYPPPPGVPPWGQPPWAQSPWGPPGGLPARFAPPPGAPPHDVPRSFLQVMRSRDWAWWRPLLGLILFAVVYSVAAFVVVLVAYLTHVAPDLAMTDLSDPVVLLITNLSLIVAIPAVWLTWIAVHGMRVGWSASVLARLRRRLFVPFTLRALVTLGIGVGLSVLVGVLADPKSVSGPGPDFGWLLLVVVLTTPLQSAAEEYVFRGYLSQAIGGWIRSPRAGGVVAALVSATLFSLAHAPGDVLTFLDRFAFGLAASAVVSLTGGLEASIVLHSVNNVLVFTLAGLLGQGVDTGDSSGTPIAYVAIDVLALAAYVWVVARSRQRLRPETRTAALDLRPGPAVLPGVVPPSANASGMVVSGVAPQQPPRQQGAPRHPWGMG